MAPRRRDDESFDPTDLDAWIAAFQRLPAALQLAFAVVLVVGGLLLGLAYLYLRQHPLPTAGPAPSVATGSPHLLTGNPSGAGTARDDYLMIKPYFALSYNSGKGTPNWVSWRLTAGDIGTAPRKPEFDPDDTLPPAFARITHQDYNGSGFDRGHMCPHEDRSADTDMSYATFVMTNVIPQAPNVNQKAWEQEESYCRTLARNRHRLYIIAGPAGEGGVGRNGPRETIAHGRVTVPSDCWKVALILDDDGYDPDPATITADARVLAVDMPNDQTAVGESWEQYRTSPADIERRTGLRFFDRLQPAVADALRQRVDRMPLPPPRPNGHGGD